MSTTNLAVRHGYTLADLGRLARTACAADRSLAADMTTRYDIAWEAIATALCETDEPPAPQELVRVGWQAIYAEVREVRRLYGIPRDKPGTGGVAASPRFAAYWRGTYPERAEERLTEELAVWQVLEVLGEPYADAINALAAHGTYQAAADALGIRYEAFTRRIRVARRTARAAWFAPDTAPAWRGSDRRARDGATHCPAGHEWTPETTLWRRQRRAGGTWGRNRRCAVCERQRDRARRAAAKAVA